MTVIQLGNKFINVEAITSVVFSTEENYKNCTIYHGNEKTVLGYRITCFEAHEKSTKSIMDDLQNWLLSKKLMI